MAENGSIPRLQTLYAERIVDAMTEEFGYTNRMSVPRLEKIVLNMGVGKTQSGSKPTEGERLRRAQAARDELGSIAGQRPVITRARKDINNFKIRKGQAVGVKVTLRRQRMYEFLDRLVTIALPRVRDFRGLSSASFDGSGNYALGIREHIVFPEIDYDKVDSILGFDICIATTARSDREARALLSHFNMPFTDQSEQGG